VSERIPAAVLSVGRYLAEELDARTWSIETLAERSGIDAAVLVELIERDYPMTDDLAAGLGRAFGTSAVLWINLDRAYQGWGPKWKRKGKRYIEVAKT
jgi:plasmid maintenance system antidote protein VapI